MSAVPAVHIKLDLPILSIHLMPSSFQMLPQLFCEDLLPSYITRSIAVFAIKKIYFPLVSSWTEIENCFF